MSRREFHKPWPPRGEGQNPHKAKGTPRRARHDTRPTSLRLSSNQRRQRLRLAPTVRFLLTNAGPGFRKEGGEPLRGRLIWSKPPAIEAGSCAVSGCQHIASTDIPAHTFGR